MLRTWSRSRRGSTAVEFALTLPMLVTTSLAVMQLGWFLVERQRFVHGSYETARFAASASGTEAPTNTQVASQAAFIFSSMGIPTEGLQVAVSRYADGVDPVVTVSVSLPVRGLGGAVTLPATHSQQFTLVERES